MLSSEGSKREITVFLGFMWCIVMCGMSLFTNLLLIVAYEHMFISPIIGQ